MGRIVSNFSISLEGVVELPREWHFQYFNGEMAVAIGVGAAACAVFLMGRVLYEEWSDWPGQLRVEPDARQSADDLATSINDVPKYVVPDTLSEPTWSNATVASNDLTDPIQALNDRSDGQIGMSGSATLIRWLLAHRLLDELNLIVHPTAVGQGQQPSEETPAHQRQLVRPEAFSTGDLSLSYVPAA